MPFVEICHMSFYVKFAVFPFQKKRKSAGAGRQAARKGRWAGHCVRDVNVILVNASLITSSFYGDLKTFSKVKAGKPIINQMPKR